MAYLRSGGVLLQQGGGGGSDPTFTETVLCDNSALSTGTLTLSDDIANYDFLKIELNNSTYSRDYFLLTCPEVVLALKSISSNRVNFNELNTSQYKCYTLSADNLTWTHYGSRNLVIKKIIGLVCTNKTVSKTEIYKRASISTGSVTITPVEDVLSYDYIYLGTIDGASDESQPCAFPVVLDKSNNNQIGVWNRYSGGGSLFYMENHLINAYTSDGNNYYLGCAYGVKFT